MTLEPFSDDEVVLMARALSIHRTSLRRKLGRLVTGSQEHVTTLDEMRMAQGIVSKLNTADLQRLGAA